MTLTEEETNRATQLLVETALKKSWADLTEKEQIGYKMIVKNLAATLDTPHTDSAVAVFMAWMGDDDMMKHINSL